MLLPRSGERRIEIALGALEGWLEVEEAGVDVEVLGASEGTFEVTVPPRLGRLFVPVTGRTSVALRHSQPSNSEVPVTIRLRCGESSARRIDWYRQAAALSSDLMPISSERSVDSLLADASHLASAAEDKSMAALVEHLRAQSLYAANRTRDSTEAFRVAESAWLLAGDPERALAARVGRVEDLIRAGDYATAALLVPDGDPGQTYFSNRLASSRCQIMRYHGHLHEAAACYSGRIAWLRAEGERAEAASMLLDQADVYRHLRRDVLAERQANEARRIADGPYAPLVRGRAGLMLYDLLLDHGDVAGAIDSVRESMGEFARMRAARWEANAFLRAAWLYVRMEAFEEARVFLEQARSILSERDAPARVAAAWLLEADIQRRTLDFSGALRAALAATSIYSHLEMPVEAAGADAFVANVQLRLGRVDAASAIMDRYAGSNAPRWMLLRARAALSVRDLRTARRVLDQLKEATPLRFAQEVERSELECRWSALAGRRKQARDCTMAAARRIVVASDALDNALLRQLMRQEVRPLRELSVELALEHVQRASASARDEELETIWQWVTTLNVAYDANPGTSSPVSGEAVSRFDRQVAVELIGRSDELKSSAEHATRSLLDILSDTRDSRLRSRSKSMHSMSLREFQLTLDQDTIFLAYLPADVSAGLLWITPRDAYFTPAVSPQRLKLRIEAVTKLASRPDTAGVELDAAALALSQDLLAAAPRETPPARLLVAAGVEFASIPWPLLHWGKDKEPLVERTNVSQLRMEVGAPVRRSGVIRVVVAQHSDDSKSELGALPAVASEARQIERSIDPTKFQVVHSSVARREELLRALETPGDWLHLAGHGQTHVDRVGYSGMWIDRPGVQAPEFLSGVDLIGRRIGSELVVLDSCELGRRGRFESSASLLTFSDAVARSGARNVVAAQWRVSDAAATAWASAFYAAATREAGTDFGAALREAQLGLRHSRRFRHPYYWASMVHTTVLPEPGLRSGESGR